MIEFPAWSFFVELTLVIIGVCVVALGVTLVYKGIWKE